MLGAAGCIFSKIIKKNGLEFGEVMWFKADAQIFPRVALTISATQTSSMLKASSQSRLVKLCLWGLLKDTGSVADYKVKELMNRNLYC